MSSDTSARRSCLTRPSEVGRQRQRAQLRSAALRRAGCFRGRRGLPEQRTALRPVGIARGCRRVVRPRLARDRAALVQAASARVVTQRCRRATHTASATTTDDPTTTTSQTKPQLAMTHAPAPATRRRPSRGARPSQDGATAGDARHQSVGARPPPQTRPCVVSAAGQLSQHDHSAPMNTCALR
jgi:hypothetical protein